MTIAEHIKHQTAAHHAATETLLHTQELQAGTLTRAQYGRLLQLHYQVHDALAEALDADTDWEQTYRDDLEQKINWLRADLQALNLPVPPSKSTLFQGFTKPQLVGALYVSEGSMLGGRVIKKMLPRSPLGGIPDQAARFYEGYGQQTSTRWHTFLANLNAQSESIKDDIARGAIETFKLYADLWQQLA